MRSITTSLTSAIPIISIIVIGNYLGIEGNLADFAIPLLIGIVSGTYSSIFVASNIMLVWRYGLRKKSN